MLGSGLLVVSCQPYGCRFFHVNLCICCLFHVSVLIILKCWTQSYWWVCWWLYPYYVFIIPASLSWSACLEVTFFLHILICACSHGRSWSALCSGWQDLCSRHQYWIIWCHQLIQTPALEWWNVNLSDLVSAGQRPLVAAAALCLLAGPCLWEAVRIAYDHMWKVIFWASLMCNCQLQLVLLSSVKKFL